MINYLQSITVFGLNTGLQRAAIAQQKVHAIQTDDDETYDVESVRALRGLNMSTSMNEERTEERKHGLRTPQDEEDYIRATQDRYVAREYSPASRNAHLQTPPRQHTSSNPSGYGLDIIA